MAEDAAWASERVVAVRVVVVLGRSCVVEDKASNGHNERKEVAGQRSSWAQSARDNAA